ncbi:MAG: ATP-grasp domain-containing protein [Polyangiales bacterium]
MRPGRDVLEVIQNRTRQKSWLAQRGYPLGPWRAVTSVEELAAASRALGANGFVKHNTGGYDGRGQARLSGPDDAAAVWASLGASPCVFERALEISSELSVLVARSPSGETAVYPAALNHHEERILAWSVLPGPVSPGHSRKAEEIARQIAQDLGVEGLLVVELFVTRDGELFVNELAPRPHNSFHATEVACLTSQFEQHVRAVCDLPLGSVEVVRPVAIRNLLGDLWLGETPPRFDEALGLPGVRVHLYGKRVARPGRKMGHLSAVGATPADAVSLVETAYARLAAAR